MLVKQLLDVLLPVASRARRLGIRARSALMDVRRGRPIDQQAEQLGAAVVTTRVHEPFARVDLNEVEICNRIAFTGFDGPGDEPAIRADNGGEAAAGYRPDGTTRILHDLGLLIGIEPRRRAHHKGCGFQGVLTDVGLRLLREDRTEDRSGVHGRVDLLAIGYQRVARERKVVLPAGELADPANSAIDGAQARAVALAPDHALVIGRRDLAAALDQRTVRIEEELRIVDRAPVALIDADRSHQARV